MASIGPQLPPGFTKNQSIDSDDSGGDDYGPSLPPSSTKNKDSSDHVEADHTSIGPCLPPHLQKQETETCTDVSSSSNPSTDNIGPALPPHLAEKLGVTDHSSKDTKYESSIHADSIGPALPAPPPNEDKLDESDGDDDTYGPALPPDLQNSDSESDSDGDMIGPMPSTGTEQYSAAEEFERRARLMKCKLAGEGEQKAPVRESWMMELPAAKVSAQLGLQARSFRSKAAPELDSAWTETPADRARKQQEAESSKSKTNDYDGIRVKERDADIAAKVDSYNESKRKESLLDMHQKSRKSKKEKEEEEEGGPPKRRAFDRDLDLKVNRFDDAQRKSYIKKSQQLDTRFGHGQSKFI